MAKRNTDFTLPLPNLDDLFSSQAERDDAKLERIKEVSLDLIDDFQDHPYKVKDDECMMQLVDSIQERGLIQPVLVRPIKDGRYEMVCGHRRKRAFEILGLDAISARVVDLTRDEAILSMVDSNLQREEITPSEKAFAYKMRLEAMKRRAGRPSKSNLTPVESNYKELRTNEQLGQEVGESREQIRRYIRLTELIPPLLKLVDEKMIAMRPAVEISYLSKEAQEWLNDAIECNDCTPSHAQTLRMRKFAEQGKLSQDVIDTIMDEEKPNQKETSPFRDKRIAKAIPPSVPKERQSEYVIKAIEHYNKFREKQREHNR